MMRLTNVDLPTLGRPTTATTGRETSDDGELVVLGHDVAKLGMRSRTKDDDLVDDLVERQGRRVDHHSVLGLGER